MNSKKRKKSIEERIAELSASPKLSAEDKRLLKTLKQRLSMKIEDGRICLRLNLKELCGEETDLYKDLEDVAKKKMN